MLIYHASVASIVRWVKQVTSLARKLPKDETCVKNPLTRGNYGVYFKKVCGDIGNLPHHRCPPECACTAQHITGEQAVEQDTGTKRRILVVDNDEKLLLAVQEWLEGYDYQVKTVATGIDALRLMRSETFDVLITDIVMPDISGIGLIEISQKEFPGLLTIAITGYAEKVKNLVLERSPDYLLEKPFKSRELLEALESVLAKG